MTVDMLLRFKHILSIQHFLTHFHSTHDKLIISFGDYVATKFLCNSCLIHDKLIYSVIKTMAIKYLHADLPGICKCIAEYNLKTILFGLKLPSHLPKPNHQNHTITPYNHQLTTKVQNQTVVSCCEGMGPHVSHLLALFEHLLVEYFSVNWDNIPELLHVNEEADGKKKSHLIQNKYNNVNSKSDSHKRAVQNWKKAYKLVVMQLVIKSFGVQRQFWTFAQIFKDLKRSPSYTDLGFVTKKRNPILLLLGGGMAAGKSTVREIIGTDAFWSKVGKDAVVVEADAIKNHDVVFKMLQKRFKDDMGLSEMVHEYSTTTAEAMLVQAINERKDIVFDGTMTWYPFVKQTIEMARDNKHNYKRGPGYYTDNEGMLREEYWKIDENEGEIEEKIPYTIEFVGVTCDPSLAVARGIWRKLRSGRGVPIKSQLRSHRLFSENFEKIAHMVDSATLYDTGTHLTSFGHPNQDLLSPKVIAHVSSGTQGQMIILNQTSWNNFQKKKLIVDTATSSYDIYGKCEIKKKLMYLSEKKKCQIFSFLKSKICCPTNNQPHTPPELQNECTMPELH